MHHINSATNVEGLSKAANKLITHEARPFLKWAGGKRRLLKYIVPLLPRNIRAYHEPFVGGGALFFWLRANGFCGPAQLYDANEELIRTYLAIQKDPSSVVAAFDRHAGANCEGYYYEVRDQRPESLSDAMVAGRMLYLNRAGFNGLYRQNKSGLFNTSWGKNEHVFLDSGRMYAAYSALQNTQISFSDFSSVLQFVEADDLVYADPPYPNGFNTYCSRGFCDESQGDLAKVCGLIDQIGANFIVSNGDCGLIRNLYSKFNIMSLMAPRSISRNGRGRRKTAEVLVSNCGSISQSDHRAPYYSVVQLGTPRSDNGCDDQVQSRSLSFGDLQVEYSNGLQSIDQSLHQIVSGQAPSMDHVLPTFGGSAVRRGRVRLARPNMKKGQQYG